MDKSQLKIVFAGTPQFSADILQGLLDDGFNITAVISESDKPAGRNMEVVATPVKKFAIEKGLPVYQPANSEELQAISHKLQADLYVVAAYGRILKKEVLEQPKFGCLNFHTSLLPELRGASPIQTAILEGLKKTGVTIMKLDEGMDTGPILSQVEIEIGKNETTTTLREKLLGCGLPLLLNTIPGYVDGEIEPKPQDEKKATYSKLITKEDGHLDFAKSAFDEERKLRAFNEWPGVYGFWEEKRVKFVEIGLSTTNYESDTNIQIKQGEVFLDENKNLCIKFNESYWIVKRLQLEGKKEMSAKDFLNGNREIIRDVLK